MVKMRKMLAPERPGYNCYEGTNEKKFLVIHQTGNERIGADANMHAILQAGGYGASWHWQVDDKETIQSFEHRVQCWHASDGRGDGNLNSIAIEICINQDGDYVKAVQNGAELAAWILKEENISLANMKQHHDFARDKKNCPAQIRAGKAGISWTKFVQMVQVELDKLNGKVAVASGKAYKVHVTLDGYISSNDAKAKKNPKTKVESGSYTIYSEANNMINVTTKSGVPGSWINPSDNKAATPKPAPTTGGVIKKMGTFVCNDTILVRNKPTTSAAHVATYKKGESLHFDEVHIKNGYVWLEYTRAVGGKGYLPIGPISEVWGSFK